MDAELEKRIDAGEEKNRNQDEEIARQAALNVNLEKQISQLIESNCEKELLIKELQEICKELSKNISDNALVISENDKNFLDRLDDKASKTTVIVSYVIGVVGLIAAIIQFFI